MYEKQVQWKRNQAYRAKTENGNKDEEDMTFQPIFFTSKDTSRKFRVNEKVETLTTVAGNHHVDRFKKAAQLREEAHRKLYGQVSSMGNGKGQGVGKNPRPISPQASKHSHPHSGYSTTGMPARSSSSSSSSSSYSTNAGSNANTQSTSPFTSPRSFLHAQASGGGGEESLSVNYGASVIQEATKAAMLGATGTGAGALAYNMQAQLDASAAAEADDYSVVELLERERREWHAERTKLVQCIHLQQLELAARASAAQETAGTIAKEFAVSIEDYEARLMAVEGQVQRELGDIKDMLRKLLPA